MSHHDPEHPFVRPFRSPFELGLAGMIAVAIAIAFLAVVLFLTDVGVVNW